MKFLYHKDAKNENIEIDGEAFLHLKVRRVQTGERIDVRNLKDGQNHIYEVINFGKKSANLSLIFSHDVEASKDALTLIWAVVEPKIIEKTLPSLNEMGVSKIVFFYGEFSQKNFKIDFERLERILINSCEQCGRNNIMSFEIYPNLSEVVKIYPNVALVDFEGANLENYSGKEILAVGAEGGFSASERAMIAKKYSLKSKNILRSQTAILSVAAKILV